MKNQKIKKSRSFSQNPAQPKAVQYNRKKKQFKEILFEV